MKAKKAPLRGLSRYNRQLLKIADKYLADTGADEIDPNALTDWAVANGYVEVPKLDPKKVLARRFSQAMRADFVVDENDEPVRHRLAYPVKGEEKQIVMFFKMEDATPQKMQRSADWRRRGITNDCAQLHRDLAYYNKRYNPNPEVPVQISFNFESDVEERLQSTEYDDSEPSADDGKES